MITGILCCVQNKLSLAMRERLCTACRVCAVCAWVVCSDNACALFLPPPASVGRWKSQKMVRAVSDFGATMGDVNLATAMFAIANMHAHMGDCPRKAFLKLVCRCALWRCCCVVEMPLCGGHAAV